MTKRTVVIVDAEGEFPKITSVLIDDGTLAASDLHIAAGSLEEDNASLEELVNIARDFARESQQDLDLSAEELKERVDQQKAKGGAQSKGLGETLLNMARDPNRGGSISIPKPLLAERLADLAASDYAASHETASDALLSRRPLLAFFLRRIGPLLAP